MRPMWYILALGMVGLLAPGAVADAETSGCLPSDDEATSLLSYAVELATSSDPEIVATREDYGILAVPESDVELVTDGQTCKKAAREYKSAIGLSGQAPDVHVVRIGTRYIVEDPNSFVGEYVIHVVFDQQFNQLAVFGA